MLKEPPAMPTPFALVLTTCSEKQEAQIIASRLVEDRLSACVQMFPIESVYRWEGEVQEAEEWMLLCKIKAADYAKVEAAIRDEHSYSNPEIIQIGIENGSPDYLSWILSETSRE
jgi:periplasmic divalent cation tolerance protein